MTEKPDWMAPGALYIVPTPIGNLGDMSPRSAEVLSAVEIIAAEDTRTTRRLISALNLRCTAKIVSHHDHNANASAEAIILKLKEEGLSAAIVSEAGTPGCSDPGYRLVRAAIDADVPVIPLPGPAAFLCALVGSGLPTDRFYFAGFLPTSSSKRAEQLGKISEIAATLCFYVSPRRIISVLEDLCDAIGDRKACIGRELTKKHEELLRGSLTQLHAELSARQAIRGEMCLLVEGHRPKEHTSAEAAEALRLVGIMREQGIHPKAIKKSVAAFTGMRPNEVYSLISGTAGSGE